MRSREQGERSGVVAAPSSAEREEEVGLWMGCIELERRVEQPLRLSAPPVGEAEPA